MKIIKTINQYQFKDSKSKIELKNEDSDTGKFSGYASVFNHVDLHDDIILPGAFKECLEADEVKLLWQHDQAEPIGKITKLTEDNKGLFMEASLLMDLHRAKEAYSLLKNKIIKGLSIGFAIKESYYDRDKKQ
jgi:HK97 family phage prohead protease